MSDEIDIPAALQQIALMTGLHYDCKLLTYYNETAESMARLL